MSPPHSLHNCWAAVRGGVVAGGYDTYSTPKKLGSVLAEVKFKANSVPH